MPKILVPYLVGSLALDELREARPMAEDSKCQQPNALNAAVDSALERKREILRVAYSGPSNIQILPQGAFRNAFKVSKFVTADFEHFERQSGHGILIADLQRIEAQMERDSIEALQERIESHLALESGHVDWPWEDDEA